MSQIPSAKAFRKVIQVGIFLTLIASPIPLLGQHRVPIEPYRPIRVISYHGAMVYFLSKMPREYRVVVGIEMDPTQSQPAITLELQSPSIEDVLNAVVSSQPRYQWRRQGAFYDIYPKSVMVSILDTPVENFQATDVTETEAITRLMSLPEMRTALRLADLQFVPQPIDPKSNQKRFQVDVAGVTLREALHQITRASGSQFWLFQRTGKDNKFLSITTVVE